MDLILWRHAEAEDGVLDLQRKLTAKGVRQARYSAAWLKQRLPERFTLLASDALRSQQTAQALSPEFVIRPGINPGCSVASFLSACNWGKTEQTLVAVGHQPTLGRVAASLLAGSEQDWSVKKSAVWWLSCRERLGERQILLKAVLWPDEQEP